MTSKSGKQEKNYAWVLNHKGKLCISHFPIYFSVKGKLVCLFDKDTPMTVYMQKPDGTFFKNRSTLVSIEDCTYVKRISIDSPVEHDGGMDYYALSQDIADFF